ncbi:MAG: SDR family oxidoreductase [Candidatus Marithrix sp.]
MRIFITGASGFIGQNLLPALLANGHEVIASIRHPEIWQERFPTVKWLQCDYNTDNDPQIWLSRLTNIDIVINAVGIITETKTQSFINLHVKTPIALFKAAHQLGIKKMLQISALGANKTATSKYHTTKYTADEALLILNPDAVILQPSIIVGRGGGSTTLFTAMAALPFIPAIGQAKIQPILIDDVIAIILKLIENWPSGKRLELVGMEAITLNQLLILLRNWLNFPPTFTIRIPLPLIKITAKLNDKLKIGSLNSDTLGMLLKDNCADPVPMITATKITPKLITVGLQNIPATTADRWYARLLLLQPLLKITIGLLWIFTGIISAFFYPVTESYKLLAATGISGIFASIMLYSAAVLDIILGIATLISYKIRLVVSLQLLVIMTYTVIISLFLPELWLHPFGAISKNIPLLVATLIMLTLEEK